MNWTDFALDDPSLLHEGQLQASDSTNSTNSTDYRRLS